MSALVPYEHGGLVRRSGRRNSGSVLQLAAAGVAADVRVESVDRRNRCSWYALKVGAKTSNVTGRLVGVRRGGAIDELGSVDADAGCVSSARFAVTTPRAGAYAAMFLEIRSAELMLRVEAPRPPASGRFALLKPAATLFVLGAAAIFAGTVPFALAHPSVHGPAAPAAAATLPQTKPLAAVTAARVQSFSARRDAAPGGRETVLASYLAVGDRGSIALLDGDGTIVATAPFSRVGTVRLPVPRAYRTLPMTAQITVHRGATKAVSSVAVPPAATAPATTPTTAPAQASLPAAVEGHAIAGRPLTLTVSAQKDPVRIELEDASGASIAETEVAPGATRASLPLPAATERTTYLVALHYARDGGEETVIRTVVAAPR